VSEAHVAHREAQRKDELLRCANLLGHMYRTLGMLEKAEQLLRETTKLVRTADGDRASTTVHFIFQHGTVLSHFDDRLEEAEALLREAVVSLTATVGPDKEDTLNASGALAMVLRRRSKEGEAETLLVSTLERARAVLGFGHRITLATLNNLGVIWSAAGKLSETEKLYREAMAAKKKVFGEHHPSTLNTVHNLGALLHKMGRLDEAHALLSEELIERRAVQGKSSASKEMRSVLAALGKLDKDRGLVREAEALLRECIDTQPSEEAADDLACAVTSTAAYALAELLQAAGRADEAKPFQELAAKHAPLEQDNVTEQFAAEWSIVQLANAKVWATRFRNRTISAQGHSSDGGAVDDGLTLDA